MNPTYAIALYISIFALILTAILLFNVLRFKKFFFSLHKDLEVLKKDINKLKQAEKELVGKVVSRDRSKELFREEGILDIRGIKRENRQQLKIKRRKKFSILVDKFEAFVGTTLLDKLGIISLLVGLVLLVGVGIEYNWINSIGRVFLGLVIAGFLLLIGYLFKKRFPVLGAVLIGGGFASVIFTIFAAFYLYALLTLWLAYLLVFVVILIAVGLSIITGRSEIAALTFAAGFLGPLTVNLTTGDYWVVFTFIILLNIGVIIYDYYRKSLLINIVSFAFTYLLYAIWLIDQYWFRKEEIPFYGSIAFLTIFYLMVFAIVLINNVRENRRFLPIEFSMLVSANLLYYTAGYIIIVRTGVEYKGIFTLWIALVNYGFFLFLYPRKNFDRRILNLFLGLFIMFLALVIPVEYMGKSPTLVWAVEAIVLMFVGIRANIKGMKLGSVELTILMLASLAFDLYDQYLSLFGEMEYIRPIFNKGFLSSMLAVLSLLLSAGLLKMEKLDYYGFKFIKKRAYQAFLVLAAVVIFYISFRLELKSLLIQIYENEVIVKAALSILNYGILFLLALPALFIRNKGTAYLALFAFVVAYVLYLADYAFSWADLRNLYLLSPFVNIKEYAYHYYSAVMLLVISVSGFVSIRYLYGKNIALNYLVTTLFFALLLVFLSNELDNLIIVKRYQPDILIRSLLTKVFSMYYTMLWAVYAVIILLLGFLYRIKELRVVSIVFMVVILLKIGIYDISRLRNDELMIVFLWVGMSLLIASLIFQMFSGNKEKIKQQAYKPDSV